MDSVSYYSPSRYHKKFNTIVPELPYLYLAVPIAAAKSDYVRITGRPADENFEA